EDPKGEVHVRRHALRASGSARVTDTNSARSTCCLYLSLSYSLSAGRRPAAADAGVACPAGALAPAGLIAFRSPSILRFFDSSILRFEPLARVSLAVNNVD